MATGTRDLPIKGATFHGASGSAAPILLTVFGTESDPKKAYPVLRFSASVDNHAVWAFRMPSNYASGPVLKLQWQTNDVGAGETCVWGGRLGAVTPADADTPQEHALAAATTGSTDANTTEANRLLETSISFANLDSVAAGDLVFVMVYRDADNGSDDLSSVADLLTATLEYTTT